MSLLPATEWLPDAYTVWRFPPGTAVPQPGDTAFGAVLCSPTETTVVAPDGSFRVPDGGVPSGPWRVLRLDGPLPHDAVGILARLSGVLARRGVPIFALSTADTDYVMVPQHRSDDAEDALRDAGYTVRPAS